MTKIKCQTSYIKKINNRLSPIWKSKSMNISQLKQKINLLLLVQKGFFHSVLSTCKRIKINIPQFSWKKLVKHVMSRSQGLFLPFQGTFDLAHLLINSVDIDFLSEVMLEHTAPHDIDDAKASNVDLNNNNKQTTLKLLHS